MKRHNRLAAAVLLVLAFASENAFGQASDTETFTVTVNPVLTINAPAAAVSLVHDTTNANQVFAAQRWTVTQNGAIGASVTFSTNQAFTHTVAPTFQRDAQLDLVIFSSDAGSGWAITTASDVTDYANAVPDGVATVAAASTAPGDAAFDLTVTFITNTFSTLASGNYDTTVTGTITSN